MPKMLAVSMLQSQLSGVPNILEVWDETIKNIALLSLKKQVTRKFHGVLT